MSALGCMEKPIPNKERGKARGKMATGMVRGRWLMVVKEPSVQGRRDRRDGARGIWRELFCKIMSNPRI